MKMNYFNLLWRYFKQRKLLTEKQKIINLLSRNLVYYYKRCKSLEEELNNFTGEDIK